MISDNGNNALPAGDSGTDVDEVLDGLTEMEGRYVFGCGNCSEVFETVLEWGQHFLAKHRGQFPDIHPVRKQ